MASFSQQLPDCPSTPATLFGTSIAHSKRPAFPKKRFHDLRHTRASLLLAQGAQPRVVMDILGHSQISLTMDTYSHVIPALTREAASHMDAILGIEK